VFIGCNLAVVAGFIGVVRGLELDIPLDGLGHNGLLWALGTLVTAPVTTGLAVLFAAMRRGMALRDYLGLNPVAWRTLALWLGALLVFIVASDSVTILLGRPVVPDVLLEVYRTAGIPVLLWFVLIVVAPVSEELIVRGFIFKGLQHSPVGDLGAVVLTALCWAVIHVQYDAYGVGLLLLGCARLRTRSVVPGMVMHAVMNLVAGVEVVVALRRTV
jgi:hypothetical protein